MDVRFPKKKTAIDDCIELIKIEVKKKIDVTLDCRLTEVDKTDHQRIGNDPFVTTK